MDDLEIAAVVIEPHFDAVRDTFVDHEVEPGTKLSKLKRTRMVIEPRVHDSPRHFARCRDDGLLIQVAPQAMALKHSELIAILVHEFGHAADFAYPGCWVGFVQQPATWIGDPDTSEHGKQVRKWKKLWHERNTDQVEWSADSIGYAVTGRPITYCGPCLVQCFSGNEQRPRGLR